MNWLKTFFENLGFAARVNAASFFGALGHYARFVVALLKETGGLWRLAKVWREQLHLLGNYSLLIIVVSGLFVGLVMALQFYNLSIKLGGEAFVGLAVNLSLVRELAPVLSAILFAGRAGTALTAEIGLMKAGEQLAALEMMGVNPMRRILLPRFWAGVLAVPLLMAVFTAVGVLAAYFIMVSVIGIDAGSFWGQMQAVVHWRIDIANGLLKALIFGAVCTSLALYMGYEAQATPEGVARATTLTVIASALAVLALNFILTALLYF